MNIILASESPFRKKAMDLIKVPYRVCPSRIDEKAIRDDDPARLTLKLAEAKARKVAIEHPDAIIIAGDAVAAKNGVIFEKPRNKEEAGVFLRELSGSTFQFVTSLVVLHASSAQLRSTVGISEITFRSLIDDEIQAYIQKYNVLSYAGAFESDAVLLFSDRIAGCYNFVTAFPVGHLIVFLREFGAAI